MVDITDWHVIGESMRKVSTSCGPFKSTTTFCSEGMQRLSWCRRWGCHSWLQSMSAANECVFGGWIPTQNRPTHLVHGQPGAWGTTIGSVVNNFWGYQCHVPPTLLWMMCVSHGCHHCVWINIWCLCRNSCSGPRRPWGGNNMNGYLLPDLKNVNQHPQINFFYSFI